jgi:hypothetical protein
LAADLRSGAKVLSEPTRQQAAFLARVSASSVYWAEHRMGQRWLIEAGYVPLVPAIPAARIDSTALAIAPPYANDNEPGIRLGDCIGIADAELRHIATIVGAERMLEAAAAVS